MADFRPQQLNANQHTARGMGALERSMRTDGYSTPMVAAADGEVFDGSARLGTSAVLFGGTVPIVVHSDGTRPVIHVRDDIASAADPRAKRLALAANRIAQLNLDWDPALLKRLLAELPELTPGLWTDEELRAVVRALERPSSLDAEPQIEHRLGGAVIRGDRFLNPIPFVDGVQERILVGVRDSVRRIGD